MQNPPAHVSSQSQVKSGGALRASRARFWVVVFAVTLAIIQYIDRVCISQAAPSIRSELHFTEEQMGWVFSAFTLAYAVFEIPAGYLGDRIGPRKVLLRIVLWWSCFTAATGWMRQLWSLITTRFLFGAGEAGAFPNLTKAFNRWLPQAERTRAQGIMWMSARLGGAFTPLLVYYCLQLVTWRHAFMLFGLLGVVWALFFFFWFRDDPRQHPGVNAAEAALMPQDPAPQGRFHAPWGQLARSRTVWCLCGQYFACSYSFYFFITWFPTYLLEAQGLNLKRSALLAGTPLLVGAFGSLFAGWLLPLLGRRANDVGWARRWVGAAGSFGGAALLVLATLVVQPYLAVAVIALVAFCNDVQMPGAWTACMDVGGDAVATLSGTMNMMGNVGGFVSPILCGYVVGATHHWGLAFYATAFAYCLGGICWLLMDPVTPLEQQMARRNPGNKFG
ncbi:MAG TPA: MFS transporter [Verrucomicrobiae bacterium]|nr:MFS transporter [Verrucomicrobiae bacterium]